MEPLMICFGEAYLIALCLKVGRVAVDPGILSVILADDIFEVLILHDDICQPAGTFPNQVKEAANVAGLAAEGLGTAAEAVPYQLEVVRRTADTSTRRTL